jgi:hypothetical protein
MRGTLAGTDKMERLRTELAERLALWEDSGVLAKEFADELIGIVFRHYPHGLDTEEK